MYPETLEDILVRLSPQTYSIIRELLDSRRALRIFEIARRVSRDDSTVSHHLQNLEQMGIVQEVTYSGKTAFKLTNLGSSLAKAMDLGYVTEEEELHLRTRELASVLGISQDSSTYDELQQTIAKWYISTKQRIKDELSKENNRRTPYG